MRFKIPGRNTNVRLFERVETTDPQYDIFDVGIEFEDGLFDSMVYLVVVLTHQWKLLSSRLMKKYMLKSPWLHDD